MTLSLFFRLAALVLFLLATLAAASVLKIQATWLVDAGLLALTASFIPGDYVSRLCRCGDTRLHHKQAMEQAQVHHAAIMAATATKESP